MANRTLDPVSATTNDVVVVAGRFEGGGSSATTILEGAGSYTVAGAGSGVYTFTFTDKYEKLLAFVATVGAAAPGDVDTYVVIRDDFASGNTLPITTSEAGTPTDLAASEYVDFIAVFKNSGANNGA
jgi:hypothetical protein